MKGVGVMHDNSKIPTNSGAIINPKRHIICRKSNSVMPTVHRAQPVNPCTIYTENRELCGRSSELNLYWMVNNA